MAGKRKVSIMKRALRSSVLVALPALALAACGGGGDGDGSNAGAEQNFGSTFASAFRADSEADPIDPQQGDLPDVSFTTDPVDF